MVYLLYDYPQMRTNTKYIFLHEIAIETFILRKHSKYTPVWEVDTFPDDISLIVKGTMGYGVMQMMQQLC
ncbi:MAG: hypothetical protein J7L15_09075 [Clostridiales bacterium]|nr:hypothetical protein [Clostridiales bacterium]